MPIFGAENCDLAGPPAVDIDDRMSAFFGSVAPQFIDGGRVVIIVEEPGFLNFSGSKDALLKLAKRLVWILSVGCVVAPTAGSHFFLRWPSFIDREKPRIVRLLASLK